VVLVPVATIRAKFEALDPLFDERVRRLWAATEARALGYGGIKLVAEATGLSITTIRDGIAELKGEREAQPPGRVRTRGGGRKPLVEHHPELLDALNALVEPVTRGSPTSPLRWTCKSTRKLAEELSEQGYQLSPQKVGELLKQAGYSLQSTRKTREGKQHPDRNAQFEYINRETQRFQKQGLPVISVDTKKKELVGDFKNQGREWQPKGQPEEVRVHDFIDKELGKVIPYGVYDVAANRGFVNVGTDHDTPGFAVESIRQWWKRMGRRAYPDCDQLLVMADGGGSNGYRARAWKSELAQFAAEAGLRISVCHFPPGTSKWNKIEHRLFCHITQNWRGRPLISHEAVVSLIGSTTTRTGLRVRATLDEREYPTGVQISDAEMAAIPLKPNRFHGDWNYTISSA
jgi:transposase